MKRLLPIFVIFIITILFSLFTTHATASSHAPIQLQPLDKVPEGDWRIDPEVTFIGKNAARSGLLLDFTLENYNWVCVKKAANGQCDNSSNPLTGVWRTTVAFIVVPLLFIVIMVAAVVIIVTRGRSITIMRFLPRFVGVLLLIFLSFAVIQLLYQFIDVIQGFFLRKSTEFIGGASCPPKCISQEDLLFVGWNYQDFIGLRLAGGAGDQYAESAFISLLLTKLTAVTYYIMVGILVLRKIILWLFIIVSPIFPILLLFYPVRNTGKIWVGEFFRWLLYAPLFAIFLKGLVVLWREGIPLFFGDQTPTVRSATPKIYDTSVNILLGGPKEFVTPANSVNITETFALYVFSLLMLWGVIILPWILLQIFLDYAAGLSVAESPAMKALVSKVNNLRPPGAPTPPSANKGSAISLPFAKKFNYPMPPSGSSGLAREIPDSFGDRKINQVSFMPSAQVKAQTLKIVDMQLPSIRDIAKYDTSLISNDKDKQKETIQIREKLERIANPSSSTSSAERVQYSTMRDKLIKESASGNLLAAAVLNAANTTTKKSIASTTTQIKNALTQIANPQSATATGATSIINKEKISHMNESLVKAKREGNALAASILSVSDKTPAIEIEKLQERIMDAKAKGEPIAEQVADITAEQKQGLPVVNRIQTVSKEDYQEVEKLWEENYRNLEVPLGMEGTRSEWIKDDIAKIDKIVELLSAADQEKIEAGMNEVSSILPFLLVGGFSLTEIIAYLHAKQEAGKKTIAELAREEEDKIVVKTKKSATGQAHLAASVSDSSGDDIQDDLSTENITKAPVMSPSVSKLSSDLYDITNLRLPKLTDIVQYEIRHFTKDKTESERVEKMHEVLERLNNPQSITSDSERVEYEELRKKLTIQSRQGDATADVILSAANQLARAANEIVLTLEELKSVLVYIVNPEIAPSDNRDYYIRLHEYLEKESKDTDNDLAKKILSVNDSTSIEKIKEIKEQITAPSSNKDLGKLPQLSTALRDISNARQLKEFISQISTNEITAKDPTNTITIASLMKEKEKGNQLASDLLEIKSTSTDSQTIRVYKQLEDASNKGNNLANSILSKVTNKVDLAKTNRLQKVTPEEYAAARDLWEKAYRQYFVPQGYSEDVKGRIEWISGDIKDIDETINLFSSDDQDKKDEGMRKVANILPFLVLGGFTQEEMLTYLRTKLMAAQSALKYIQDEEEDSVQVAVNNSVQNDKAKQETVEKDNNK